MKRLALLLLVILSAFAANAQKYEVECLRGDSVDVIDARMERHNYTGKRENYYYAGEKVLFRLGNGDIIDAVGKIHGKSSVFNGYSQAYAVFKRDGRLCAVASDNLVFSHLNPSGTKDKILTRRQHVMHTWQGRWFSTYTPYIIIVVLFASVIALNALAARKRRMVTLAKIAIPLCILAGSALEIWAYRVLGTDCFWWCDREHHGFFGSLVRVIPFCIIVFYQIMSIRFYEPLLFGPNFDPDLHDGLSIKPTVISLLGCVPALIAAAMAVDWLGYNNTTIGDAAIIIAFLAALLTGIGISVKRNSEQLGLWSGLLLTAFGIVYVIGCVVAVWGLVIILFQLIVQVLLVLGLLFFLSCLPSDNGRWRDLNGNYHSTRQEAQCANDNIRRNQWRH